MPFMRSLAVCLPLLFAAVADAYLLPADFIVKSMSERRSIRRLRDLQVELHTELNDDGAAYSEHLYLKRPEKLRLTPSDAESDLPAVVQNGNRHAHGPATQIRRNRDRAPRILLASLFFPADTETKGAPERVIEILQAAGIDTAVVSITRHEGRPTYIIGATPWAPTLPQLWVDKETYMPVRYVIRTSPQAPMQETRLSYDFSTPKVWFPAAIEQFDAEGLRIRHSAVVRVRKNQKLPDTLFRTPR